MADTAQGHCDQDRCEIDAIWHRVQQKPRIPDEAIEFFEQSGPANLVFQSQRRFHRYYSRGIAVLNQGGTLLGVYTKDVSRDGIGFLSPIELAPQERLELHIAGVPRRRIEITRCRNLAERCFECGAVFVSAE
jgi:hypothetical protein